MLTAVQAAVVAAAAAWVIGVGVAVYVMLKAARVMSDTATAVTGLRESGDVLIARANAAIDRAGARPPAGRQLPGGGPAWPRQGLPVPA